MPLKPPIPFSQEDPTHPVRVSARIDASPPWWQDFSRNAEAFGDAVIAGKASQIRQFVSQQRLVNNLDIRRRVATFNDLDVHYMSQFGHETIHYTARPERSVLGALDVDPLTDFIAVIFSDGAD